MVRRKSDNEAILNFLIRKSRHLDSPSNAAYLVLYAFLYKYLSDKLKNYLLQQFGADGDDLRLFYMAEEGRSDIREAALNGLGYFIEDYGAYMDQFVGNILTDDLAHPEFLLPLKETIVFSSDNPSEEYFRIIMETVGGQTRFYRINRNSEQELLISNLLLSIAKLDITEEEFPFARVYDLIASSRLIRFAPTPEYITQILEKTVVSTKSEADAIYDPFLRDASNLFGVSRHFKDCKIYAKEDGELYYFYSLIRAFINECDFSDVHFKRENAINTMAFDDEMFDVIVSKIPNNFRFDDYRNQNLEAPNPNRVDVKKQLISQYDLSKLGDDEELLNALSVFERKIEAVEKSNVFNFHGEYEPLQCSEFLFVINMINCLKEDGVMAISVSQNFLFKKSLALLRKFLTYENNYIDAIISLPEDLGRSVRPEVIIVFRKNRNSGDILFIDVSKDYDAVRSKNAMPGLYMRNLIFDDSTLDRICDVIEKRRTIDKFSQVVGLEDLEKNDFNLTVSRYVDTFEGQFISLDELSSKRDEIDERMSELTKKIDSMMDDLNIWP